MKLLLDMGNTRLKWQLYEDARQQISGACDYADMLAQAALWQDLPLQGVWLASVGQSALSGQLVDCLRDQGHTVHRMVSQAQQAGVRNAYAEPDNLGVDRWLGLLAAGEWQRQHQNRAVLVVDAGTAMTLDVLHPDGAHAGGLIVPGLRMMRHSLHQRTEQLPAVHEQHHQLGRSTQQAIAAGTLAALVGALESVWRDVQREYPDASWRITGGDAELVYNALPRPVRQQGALEPDWLFKGLLLASTAAHSG